jgi:hypothetical protein
MNVTMLIITDGRERGDYLRRMFESVHANVRGSIANYLMMDDSGSPDYCELLDRTYGNEPFMNIVHHQVRFGFGETIHDAWERMPKDTDVVLHCEDDFLLNRTLNLHAWISVLKNNPRVAQIAGVRQPWSQAEIEVGGYFKLRPGAYRDAVYYGIDGKPYDVVVSSNFSTNICAYPRWVCAIGWPESPESEGKFTFKLTPHGLECLLWGKTTDEPLLHHIGAYRQGMGY